MYLGCFLQLVVIHKYFMPAVGILSYKIFFGLFVPKLNMKNVFSFLVLIERHRLNIYELMNEAQRNNAEDVDSLYIHIRRIVVVNLHRSSKEFFLNFLPKKYCFVLAFKQPIQSFCRKICRKLFMLLVMHINIVDTIINLVNYITFIFTFLTTVINL